MKEILSYLKYVLPVLPLVLGFVVGIPCPMKRDAIASKDLKSNYLPPGWMFAAMWSVIYACIGVFMYLMMKSGADVLIWVLLAVNLILNLSWTAIYSKTCLGNRELALWWLFACKVTLLALMIQVVTSKNPTPAVWLVLYSCWLDVALILNYNAVGK